ncbi:IS30 family transposase [Legionella sp. CNM-1927-20]|uniref:IS30 family transposase n=1 Tax=Legionella sp. CNM-1927-20 TaxID=3422221 RepID=UPI00403AB875
MGKHYKQLTELDRGFISLMLAKGYAKSKIAILLRVHRSTIYRELKRNSIVSSWTDNEPYYLGQTAHKRYLKRRKRHRKLDDNKLLQDYVHKKLARGWSPWQIEGRLKRENKVGMHISHETIYRYIYSDYAIRNRFYSCLRRKHKLRIKRYARHSRFPSELLITNRPQVINERAEFGHWEGDLMMFKRGIKGNLLTLRERKTRYLIAIKNENKTAKATALALISTVKSIKSAIKTITFDQGSEFQNYRWCFTC